MSDESLKNNLREAENRLYKTDSAGKNPKVKRRSTLDSRSDGVRRGWQSPADTVTESASKRPRGKKPSSLFKKFFIGAIAFFVLAIAIAAISFVGGGTTVSNNKIDIEILGRAFTDGGAPLDLQVLVTNRNSAPLELADLVVLYPESSLGASGSIKRVRESLGTVGAGKTSTTDYTIQLFGQESEVRTVTARLEYRVAGSNAIFIKEISYDITIQSSPVQMSVTGPTETVPNQSLEYVVEITSNSTEVLENMLVSVVYPFGFELEETTPEATFDTTVWNVGDLAPGTSKEIRIRGTLRGIEGDEHTLRAYVGSVDPRNNRQIGTVFNSLSATTMIRSAFLDARLSVNNQTGSVAVQPGQTVTVMLNYRNTLASTLRGVEIRVRLSGNLFDPSALTGSSGFFDSNTNEIIWSQSNQGQFAALSAGASGQVTFSYQVPTLSASSPQNPSLIATVSIQGSDTNGSILSGQGVDTIELKASSQLALSSQTLHTGGLISNTGPMPPRVGQETRYAIDWQLSNTTNDVDSVVVRTTLPSYVTWTGTTAPAGQNISYDPTSRVVTWQAGSVGNRTGTAGPRASFQVSITPSASQVGTRPALTGTVQFQGTDRSTGQTLSGTRSALSTHTPNDASSSGTDGVVIP